MPVVPPLLGLLPQRKTRSESASLSQASLTCFGHGPIMVSRDVLRPDNGGVSVPNYSCLVSGAGHIHFRGAAPGPLRYSLRYRIHTKRRLSVTASEYLLSRSQPLTLFLYHKAGRMSSIRRGYFGAGVTGPLSSSPAPVPTGVGAGAGVPTPRLEGGFSAPGSTLTASYPPSSTITFMELPCAASMA